MKKIFLTIVALIVLLSSISFITVSAEESKTYTYEDESANTVFTLQDDFTFTAICTHKETLNSITLSGTYDSNSGYIIFKVGGENFLQVKICEGNTLVSATDSEIENAFNLGTSVIPNNSTNEDKLLIEDSKDAEDSYITRIGEWIIAGLLGLFGTGAACIAFRKQLASLIASITTALGHLKNNKDSAEEDIKTVKKEAQNTLASLSKVKEEMKEYNKHEFDELKSHISMLEEIVLILAIGSKEHVINGTSEKIKEIINSKGIIGVKNENKEI